MALPYQEDPFLPGRTKTGSAEDVANTGSPGSQGQMVQQTSVSEAASQFDEIGEKFAENGVPSAFVSVNQLV
jgi:hypothetical protein